MISNMKKMKHMKQIYKGGGGVIGQMNKTRVCAKNSQKKSRRINMRKTKLIVVLTLSLLLCSASLAMAAAPAIFVNGTALVSENQAILENDRTLVPLSVIFEALNQQVDWNADEQSITAGNIWLQVDNSVATVNGENVNLDVPAKTVSAVTYVPLRFIAENLGKDVIWDGSQNRVDINDKPIIDEEINEDATTGQIDEDATIDEDAAIEETDKDAAVDEDAVDEDAVVEETDEDTAVDEDAAV
ncbi:MAG TPA: hypothetical protein DCZ10_01540, partial [Pelotomaculum sp.]|nr:hypothetical protein [Pelotomaculum sp.]